MLMVSLSVFSFMVSSNGMQAKGSFINYVRVPREVGGLEKSLHTVTLGGGGQTQSYVIFSKSIFYIRNRVVKWFGRDHISFASGR